MTLMKERCDGWIIYAYEQWIENWLSPKSSLRNSTRNIVNRMKVASQDHSEEAWSLQGRLKRLSDGFDKIDDMPSDPKYRSEKPEVYMECALVAYRLGDLQEALNLLRVSNGDFLRRTAYKAISYWLFGCIQWQLPSHSEEAVLSWERSVQILKEVENDTARSDLAMSNKCREVAEIMTSAINEASRENMLPPPPAFTAGGNSETRNSGDAVFTTTRLNEYEAKLKFIPYYGTIPAGNPAQTMNYPIGRAGISLLEIEDGLFYKIYNIKREREIGLNFGQECFILRADGHSMNIAVPVSIEHGDYVLLIKKHPQNNDIVAAVIVKDGEPATLKRYIVDNNNELFISESDKVSIRLPKSNEDYIQGVVIAILKPNNG